MRNKKVTQETATAVLTERMIFPASKELVEAITDYRFENRINSMSEALRRLVEAGLKVEHKKAKR